MFSKWGRWLNKQRSFAAAALQCCLNTSQPPLRVWRSRRRSTAQYKNFSLHSFVSHFPLSFDTFPSVPASLFSNLLFQSSLTLLFPKPRLISSFVFPFHHPTSTLSVLLSLFILTSLCKGAGGEINYHCITQSYIWQHDATDVSGNILVPFLVVYFPASRATLATSLIEDAYQIWCCCLSSSGMWDWNVVHSSAKIRSRVNLRYFIQIFIQLNVGTFFNIYFFPPVKHVLTHHTGPGLYLCWCPVTIP